MQIVKSVIILSKYLLIIDCQLEKNQNLVLTVKRLRQSEQTQILTELFEFHHTLAPINIHNQQ